MRRRKLVLRRETIRVLGDLGKAWAGLPDSRATCDTVICQSVCDPKVTACPTNSDTTR